jgi:hypothetical protein
LPAAAGKSTWKAWPSPRVRCSRNRFFGCATPSVATKNLPDGRAGLEYPQCGYPEVLSLEKGPQELPHLIVGLHHVEVKHVIVDQREN